MYQTGYGIVFYAHQKQLARLVLFLHKFLNHPAYQIGAGTLYEKDNQMVGLKRLEHFLLTLSFFFLHSVPWMVQMKAAILCMDDMEESKYYWQGQFPLTCPYTLLPRHRIYILRRLDHEK